MQNPFALPDEDLKKLLEAYSDWCKENENEEKYPEIEKQKARERKDTLLNKDYISNLSDEELVDVVFKYIKTLEGPVGIKLGIPTLSATIKEIRRNILYIINSEGNPLKKAANVLSGDYRIKKFSKSFWSPLFLAQYPELLPQWNNKTEDFLKKVGINIKPKKIPTEDKYRMLSDAYLYLEELDDNQDFYTINHLAHYATVVDEGIELINEMFNPTFKGFTENTFQLLDRLSSDTTFEAVKPISKAIHREVVSPIRNIFKKISAKFDVKDILNLEKEKHIMGKLFKMNPKYGAYPYIWGAFYQKEQKKDASMQFFIWICKDYLSCGVLFITLSIIRQ